MTPSEAIERFEVGLTVKDGLRGAYCQTGEPYLIFTNNGVKIEGEINSPMETEDLAVRYWLKYALQYKTSQIKDVRIPYILYWRYDHKIETAEEKQKWSAYGRLIITDKKEIKHG